MISISVISIATFVAFLIISTSIFNEFNINYADYKILPDETLVIVDVFEQLLTKRSPHNLSFASTKAADGQPGLPQKDESFVFPNIIW